MYGTWDDMFFFAAAKIGSFGLKLDFPHIGTRLRISEISRTAPAKRE